VKRLFSVAYTVSASLAAAGAQIIVQPRSGHPVFLSPGDSMVIELALSTPAAVRSVSAYNDAVSVPLEVLDVCWGTGTVRNGRADGYRVHVRTPRTLPPELFHLSVSCSSGTFAEPRSLAVVADMQESFSIVHVTDPHTGSSASNARFRDLLRVVDRIGARFIAVTGDVCNYPATDHTAVEAAAILNECRTPTLVGIGNHDSPRMGYAGSEAAHAAWERAIGQTYYEVHMGAVRIITHDITDPTLTAPGGWTTVAVQRWRESGPGGFRILLQHATAYWYACVPEVGTYPDLMLAGHLHWNYLPQVQPYPILVTADAASGWFRLVRVNRGADGRWVLGTHSYPGTIDGGIRVFTADGVPVLEVLHTAPEDGTAREDTVVIVNRSDERFEHVRVRCVLRRGEYEVQGARLVANYPADDGVRTVVLCGASVSPRSSTTVRVVSSTVRVPPQVRIRPNPMRPGDSRMTIAVRTASPGGITVDIHTIHGSRVTRLTGVAPHAGEYELTWDGRASGGGFVGSGVYLLRVASSDGVAWARCAVVR
jgi:hypothetical protein